MYSQNILESNHIIERYASKDLLMKRLVCLYYSPWLHKAEVPWSTGVALPQVIVSTSSNCGATDLGVVSVIVYILNRCDRRSRVSLLSLNHRTCGLIIQPGDVPFLD